MKITKAGSPGRVERVKRSGAATGSTSGSVAQPSVPTDVVSVMGIPEAEFTPKVRQAVTTLLEEVSRLTQEIEGMKRKVDDLETFADQDDLLPVLNRRAFVRELSRLQSFGERYNLKASLLYLDLNNFKPINDKHGHAAGDAVLGAFVATLRKQLRDWDIVGRLGGDEFGIVLPNAALEDARTKAASLAQAIQKMKVPFDGKSLQVGVAIGACALAKDVDIEDALAAADKDMFEAKGASKRK